MTRFYHKTKHNIRFSVSGLLKSLQLFILALSGFFIIACEEKPSMVGQGLLPGEDFINLGGDTIKVYSYSMFDSIFRTEQPQTSYLGSTVDPFFGTTRAEFVTQLRLNSKWSGPDFVVDSVKLVLHLLSVSGGTSGTHFLRMSEIADRLYTDTAYYSNQAVNLVPPSADGGFEFQLELPQLREDTVNDIEIKLPNSFGHRIFRDSTKLFYSNTRSDFRDYFKGMYFRIISIGDPTFVSLSLANDESGYYRNFFVIYLHNTAGDKKVLFLVFDAKNKNASFNRIHHEIAVPHYNDLLSLDTLTYIQGLNGIYTLLRLPGLAQLRNDLGKVAVNKAKMIIPIQTDAMHSVTDAPSNLYLRYNTTSGTKYIVPDWSVDEYHTFYDGTLDTLKSQYTFNIARFVQLYMDDTSGEVKPELELFQSTSTKNAILKANSSKKPVSFDLVYTLF